MSYDEFQTIIYPNTIDAIAISGRSGCGNTTINALVAKVLGFSAINYTMRSYAQEQGLSLEQIAHQAQQDSKLDCLVDRRQIELCLEKEHVVLSSRLAIWLLPKASLKVYLYASANVRSQRIQLREGGALADLLCTTSERDQRDAARYRKLYQIDTEQFLFADLILNTEYFNQYQAADLIVQAYRQRQNTN